MNDFSPQDAQAYLAAIVDSSDDAIIGKTLSGIITSWNKSAERIFGYSHDEAVGKHISLLIPEDRRDEEFIIIGKVKSGQRIEHFETVRKAKDGQLREISLTVSPIRNPNGDVVGASKIARDIGSARLAERSSAYLAAIVDSSDDAIISKNLDGIITSWNKSAEQMFGYSAEEAIGKHITLIIPPYLLDEEYTIIGKVKSGNKIDHFETVRIGKDGQLIDLSITVSPILNKKGEVIGASKVARNITEQKKIAAQLRETSLQKDEFLANMSHELRTPLNAVIGLAHILEKSDRLSSKEQQCVTMIRQSGDHLLSLINNILDFSKAESGLLQLDEIEFNLPDLVEKALVMHDTDIQAKGIEPVLIYENEIREFYIGDPLRLRQILTNLISNAVKFTEKGSITVKLRQLHSTEEESFIELDVADTGLGIPVEKQKLIFAKFTQADASTARNFGGSGLGLSICKSLAEAMGGTISLQSSPGLGSTFSVRVKLRHSEKSGLFQHKTSDAMTRDVLIIEDYPPNIMVASRMLDELGYSYDVAQNGLEAFRKAERGRFRTLLMDVQMPGMDGFECTRRIRESEKLNNKPPVPIIAVTAHVFEKDKAKCFEAGMNEFLPKPFTPEMLSAVLKRVWSQ